MSPRTLELFKDKEEILLVLFELEGLWRVFAKDSFLLWFNSLSTIILGMELSNLPLLILLLVVFLLILLVRFVLPLPLMILLTKLFLISLHTVETKGMLQAFFAASDDNDDKSEGDVRRGIGGGFWSIEAESDIDLSITFLGLDKTSFKEFEIEFFKVLILFVELFAILFILSEDNKLLNNEIRAELELDEFVFKFLLLDSWSGTDGSDDDAVVVVVAREFGETILKDWIILFAADRELV